jgi:hypothetical protein
MKPSRLILNGINGRYPREISDNACLTANLLKQRSPTLPTSAFFSNGAWSTTFRSNSGDGSMRRYP